MFDCHVHSCFSGDSEIPVETACNRAIEIGLSGITFTDHLDIDYPGYDASFDIDFDAYSKYMEKIKLRYEKEIKVLKGIEVGIQPHVLNESEKIIKKHGFDFVISSVHVIDHIDPYYGDYYIGKTKDEAFGRYLEELQFCVNNFKDYDVIGHIGYIRRYCSYDDKSLRYNDYCDFLDSILKTVIEDGKGIEINSSGYRTAIGTPMPDYDIVTRYKELGGEIITVGSDAHFEEHIGHSFDIVREKLLDAGFRYTAHYESRKPIFDKL